MSALNQWQPIETAPKTSKAILVYCAERESTFTVTWVRDEEYLWSGKWKHFVGDFLNEAPTHWRPLPEAPKAPPEKKSIAFVAGAEARRQKIPLKNSAIKNLMPGSLRYLDFMDGYDSYKKGEQA